MKNKFLLKRPLCVLIIFALVFGVYGIFLLTKGDSCTFNVNYPSTCTFKSVEIMYGEEKTDESKVLRYDAKDIEVHDSYVKIPFHAVAKGEETVEIRAYCMNGFDSSLFSVIKHIKVGAFNVISENINNYIYLAFAAFSLLIFAYYIFCFVNTVRTKRYSYDAIFFLSVVIIFGLFLALWTSGSAYSYMQYHSISSSVVYSINQNFTTFLTIGTLPFMFVFVLSVSASNIELIRKEGFKPANMLGIITSAAMLLGLAAVFVIFEYTSIKDSHVFDVLFAVVSSLYIFFEIMLVSAIIYGIYVSRYTPKYDKDYIIILGCKIKPDGTLYNLIKGRADKAIEFYKAQLEKTGKAACFIPSGGKGSDEIMAEGEAVKNYLIEQGIPEEHIIAETQSATTRENMKFSKAIIDERTENAKVVFSTTSYHVFRSGAIAYRNGIKIEGIGAKTKWYFWPNAFLREVAGIFTTQPKKQIVVMALIALCAGFGSLAYYMMFAMA